MSLPPAAAGLSLADLMHVQPAVLQAQRVRSAGARGDGETAEPDSGGGRGGALGGPRHGCGDVPAAPTATARPHRRRGSGTKATSVKVTSGGDGSGGQDAAGNPGREEGGPWTEEETPTASCSHESSGLSAGLGQAATTTAPSVLPPIHRSQRALLGASVRAWDAPGLLGLWLLLSRPTLITTIPPVSY